ncbi:methyl-accepting chemotaxis protein [Scatolibacter rhodanostii]|uniref:methyl-accepting chemotaxis protein n=1 Tax=Scatolibacter rhodanostii TaxID=2014781 RepID=UPI0013565A73|nr:methyl-accepting chemotaxis protein [Scatolibacter rhodanostii]
MKYLKNKLLIYTSVVLVITVTLLTAISSILYFQSTMKEERELSSNLVSAYAQGINIKMDEYRNRIQSLASSKDLSSGSTKLKEKALAEETEENGFLYLGIADAEGNNSRGDVLAGQTFFEQAKSGTPYISSPITNEAGEVTLFVAAPLEGKEDVLYGEFSYAVLSTILDEIKIGEGGYAFAIGADGFTVLHPDIESVKEPVNYFELAEKEPSYKPTAEMFGKMIEGQSGTAQSYYKGVRRLVGYTPLNGVEGWSIAVTRPITQVEQGLRSTMMVCVGVGLILLIITFVITQIFAKKITNPIVKATERIELFAKGDLQTEVENLNGKDESARLMQALQHTIGTLREYIHDISFVLNEVAEKNLTARSAVEYQGDFVPIQGALKQIVESLSVTLDGISQATVQVQAGAEQVALGGQSLAQNSTEQSATTEQLLNSLELVSSSVQENAEYSEKMQEMTQGALSVTQQGNKDMQKMQESMQSIDAFSKKIQGILQVMDDISFQTNILALNAAVEASHAGAAGKGFSVVADEVRQLAAKSADAAKNTAELIENTIQSVGQGMKNVEQTAGAFEKIVEQTTMVDNLAQRMAMSLEEQSNQINELDQGMRGIADVTQANSATAEESAATSEELLSQVQNLEQMVSTFKRE